MALSMDCIHQQYQKENVGDLDVDEEESKEFQKLSLNDVPQVPKSGKPLEQKPAGDFLYQDFSKCLAPYNFSPFWDYNTSLPKVHDVLIHDEKPDKSSPSTYSPLHPPDFPDKWDYKAPKNVEEYVRLNRFFEDRAMFSFPPQK